MQEWNYVSGAKKYGPVDTAGLKEWQRRDGTHRYERWCRMGRFVRGQQETAPKAGVTAE